MWVGSIFLVGVDHMINLQEGAYFFEGVAKSALEEEVG